MLAETETRSGAPDPSGPSAPRARVTLPVEGMSCAGCSAAVQRRLDQLEGVDEASVNLATSRATVLYEPERIAVPDLAEAIRSAGYQVPAEALARLLEPAEERWPGSWPWCSWARSSRPGPWGGPPRRSGGSSSSAPGGPGWSGTARRWRCRWRRSGSASAWSSARGRRCRWTGSSSRAAPPWTSPWSPASRSRWTRSPATRWSAARSTPPAPSTWRPPGWERTRCSRRSSGWWRRPRPRGLRSSAWRTGSRPCSCRPW